MTQTAPLTFPPTKAYDAHAELPGYPGRWRVVEWTKKEAAPHQVEIDSRGPGVIHLRTRGDLAVEATLFADPSLRHFMGTSDEPTPKRVCVSLWSQLSRDRLILAYDDSKVVVAAERETGRSDHWTVDSFLLGKTFDVVAEKVNGGGKHNPSRSRVHFEKVDGHGPDAGLFSIFADDHDEPYDCLLYNAAAGALESIKGWRQVSIQPARDGSGPGCLFAMYDRKRLAAAGEGRFMAHELMPDVSGDDVGVWGAEEG